MKKSYKSKNRFASSGKLTMGLIIFIAGILFMSGAEAEYVHGKKMSCGNDELCQSIEGKEFDMILFSEFGSELVVLYDKRVIGNMNIAISGSPYREEMGTVLDAVHFLAKTSEYIMFTTSRAIKSVGWFGSERINNMYIVRPIYDRSYHGRSAKYVIRDRDGVLELRIKPIYFFGEDGNRKPLLRN